MLLVDIRLLQFFCSQALDMYIIYNSIKNTEEL